MVAPAPPGAANCAAVTRATTQFTALGGTPVTFEGVAETTAPFASSFAVTTSLPPLATLFGASARALLRQRRKPAVMPATTSAALSTAPPDTAALPTVALATGPLAAPVEGPPRAVRLP